MAFDSYRDFVNALDRAGELKRISQPVATELEITEIADRERKSPGGGKALLFEKPTVNGVLSPFPVAINTLGSHKRMALSMGAESVDEVANELGVRGLHKRAVIRMESFSHRVKEKLRLLTQRCERIVHCLGLILYGLCRRKNKLLPATVLVTIFCKPTTPGV
jgi:UbiD family decarboxylase